MEARSSYQPLRTLVGPYILRRLKTDKRVIADLPEKVEMSAFCHLSREQAALYEQAVRDLAEKLEEADGIQRRGLVLAQLMRLKQICNHPAQLVGTGDYAPEHSGKFQRLAELCEELGERQEKALVFTQFREITGPLAQFLEGVFGRPGLVLHGGTAVAQRRRARRELSARGRAAVLRPLAQGRRYRTEPHRRLPRHPLRPLVEPRRRKPGH